MEHNRNREKDKQISVRSVEEQIKTRTFVFLSQIGRGKAKYLSKPFSICLRRIKKNNAAGIWRVVYV